MTNPLLNQIARICAEAPEDALSRIADALGFKEQQAELVTRSVTFEITKHKPRKIVLDDNEQQAEPVGDERAALSEASKWLHAAYDRPPQTPECLAMLARIDRAAQSGQRADVAEGIPEEAYCALEYVERVLAAIANRQEQLADTIQRVDTIGAASKRAKAALNRLQAVAHHFAGAIAAAPTQQQERSDGGVGE